LKMDRGTHINHYGVATTTLSLRQTKSELVYFYNLR
jgi:hypothetical protein